MPIKGRTTSGIAELPNFEHFGTSLPNCLRTVRRPLLYYREASEGEHLVIFLLKVDMSKYSHVRVHLLALQNAKQLKKYCL